MAVGTIILLQIKMRFLFILITMCWFSLDCSAGFTTDDYKDALGKSILFFEGQRSGKLPSYQHQTWRGDSGLNDGFFANVSLVGGYYDAGDNVKFGLPMAFTTTMLAWSLIEFGYLMPQWHFENALSALSWSTDYLVQAATATPNTLYVQVGDVSLDHKCWERPEDMDTPRTVYKVTPENPGSDVAGETAAALAAASIVYNSSRPSFSSTLLTVAMKMFDFADNYRGNYSDSLGSAVCPEYCSYSGYNDELLWAASWLYKASGNSVYLNYIVKNGPDLGGDKDDFSFSWDDKGAGTKILLSKIFLIDGNDDFVGYKHSSDNYVCNLLPGATRSTAQYTPGGLLYKQEGTNLQYVTSATFLLLTYVNYLSSKDMSVECEVFTTIWDDLVSQAKKQVDYILGENPAGISYMVGFGPKYPQHIHHRGSSIPSIHDHPDHIDCQDGSYYLDSVSPNPNVHIGAVVGGPDSNDGFADDRNNFAQSEPTTYVNAPLVGALAYFYGIPQDEMSFKNQD